MQTINFDKQTQPTNILKNPKKSGGPLHALVALFFLVLTTCLFFVPVFVIGLLKLIPIKGLQASCTKGIDFFATLWCSLNNAYINKFQTLSWQITGLNQIEKNNWNLVIANHQTWLDIVVLQYLFNNKIPVLKFFVKDQLKWIPLLGFAWWAMGCPFMKRYSKSYLAKNPHKKGKDLISAQKAINKFKQTPASIMSFIEGTRFTKEKQTQQDSPYTYLLKPKAGGISTVISTMGQQLNCLIDVTIIYPHQQVSLWDFLCKRLNTIKVHVRQLPIPPEFCTLTLAQDPKLQAEFKDWLNTRWVEKDFLFANNQYH